MSRLLNLLDAHHGQCRLSVASATSLLLSQYGGQNINIAGLPVRIPSAGVTIGNSGLSASTLYYVYAYLNAGALALELSTTGHSKHTNGIETKTGDTTRTLVGMLYTNSSSQFVNSITRPTLLNWFNRSDICGATTTVSGSTASTASFAEITTSGRITFLAWADEAVEISVVGEVSSNSSGNNSHNTSPGLDGAAYGAQTTATTYAASVSLPAIGRAVSNVSEGMHTASAFGKVSAGTGTWVFGTQLKTRG